MRVNSYSRGRKIIVNSSEKYPNNSWLEIVEDSEGWDSITFFFDSLEKIEDFSKHLSDKIAAHKAILNTET